MKYTLIPLVAVIVLIMIWSVVQYIYVNKLEKPKYSVLETKNGYEVRKYESYITASTVIEDTSLNRTEKMNAGFRKVAGYIFGDNKLDTGEIKEIAMTSPVIEEDGSLEIAMTVPVIENDNQDLDSKKVSFVLPSEFTLETLPEPNNKDVVIEEISEQYWAVLGFSGLSSDEKKEKYTKRLLEKIGSDYQVGRVQFAYYDPPSTLPFLRKNEVWIELLDYNN